jgi:hypothetical protein
MSDAHYIGRPKTEWLDDGRSMELLEDFAFVDAAGVLWTAPAGSIVDGASIPKFLWSLNGSPFVGRYRDASVIHDVYCVTRSRPHDQVHWMFYNAMICSNVSSKKAEMMYRAVTDFGPKWDENGEDILNFNLDDDEENFSEW